MVRLICLILTLAWLAPAPCWAQQKAGDQARILESMASQLFKWQADNSRLLQENQKLAIAEAIKSLQLKRAADTLASSIKVKPEIKHDHDRFVFGSRYYLRLHISNDSDITVHVPPSKVVVHVPSELVINDDHAESLRTRHTGIRRTINDQCDPIGGPTTMFNNNESIVIPSNSTYVMIWDCPPDSPQWDLSALLKKVMFRPDTYTFIVNVPFEYDFPGSNKVTTLVKTGEAAVRAELDHAFIAGASLLGALIAVASLTLEKCYTNYRNNKINYPHRYQAEKKRILVFFALFALVGFLLPPILVAGANITQTFQHGLTIKIHDFLGAVISGLLAQLFIMTVGILKVIGMKQE